MPSHQAVNQLKIAIVMARNFEASAGKEEYLVILATLNNAIKQAETIAATATKRAWGAECVPFDGCDIHDKLPLSKVCKFCFLLSWMWW